ncbi:MAG: beta-galactosidase, partial [Planctomycetota bacterium]|nr:beta-galactosidase [Planctomycetota bacterium]
MSGTKGHRQRDNSSIFLLPIFAAAITLPGTFQCHSDTWRIEAELAGDGNVQKVVPRIKKLVIRWKFVQAEDASHGAFMGGMLTNETHPIACRIPHAGTYRVWVRHYKTIGKPTSFFILFRDDIKSSAGLRNIDFFVRSRNVTALPQNIPEAPEDAKPEWAWTSCEYVFERPMEATVSFGRAGGITTGKQGIDCVIVSDDLTFDPKKVDWKQLPIKPGPMQTLKSPRGMSPAPPLKMRSSFFAGAQHRDDQIKLCIVHAYNLYRDYPFTLQLGFNRDRGWHAGSVEYGVQTQTRPSLGYTALDLMRSIPSPEGRRVNAAGKVSKKFSNSYEPFRKAVIEEHKEEMTAYFDMEEMERWVAIGESGGMFDYSDPSRDRFHKYLKKRFGTIEKLNELWRTKHESFARIPLPKTPKPEDNKAPWFAFREFRSLEEATLVGEKVRLLRELDPKKRPVTSQASCLHINSPWFTSTGPFDFEEMINVGFADSPMFGWDAYSTEDYFIGADAEFLLSLVGDRELLNGEGNTHGQDPRIAVRSNWCMLGKGIKGIDTWQLQDNPVNWVYSMWGMLKEDLSPRDKLASISDANHEVHRIERLLRHARRSQVVKPVALYYSRMDLLIPQPLFDIYGASIDSPYRIYEVLRGLGYPVGWITPKQIEAGGLKDVGAVALVGVKYIPGEACRKLAKWVEEGGCIIGDSWPGAFDEYDRQQGTLLKVFGIRADEPGKKMSPEEARLALEEAATPVYAIDPIVLKSLGADEFYKSVDEMFDQRDSKHPVAKAVSNWHLSGYDGKNIQVLSGEIIGQMMGKPGLVINDYGKGHALYSAIMLGTLYEAGPIRFEWDSSREGPGLGNILDAFLRYCGLEPSAQAKLPWRMARKMRIELPLV